MNTNDRKRFLAALLKTKVSLPGPNLSKEESVTRDLVFWELLEKYSIEAVEASFNLERSNLSFFPTPKEIIQNIESGITTVKIEAVEEKKQIPWAEPTEEGKKMARECLDFVLNKIEERENLENKARAQKFKERRAFLKKQALLIEE